MIETPITRNTPCKTIPHVVGNRPCMVFFPHLEITLLMKKSLTTIKNMKKIVSKWFSLCFFALCGGSAFFSAGGARAAESSRSCYVGRN